MKRFEIIYDYYDEEFGISTLRTWEDTYEDAEKVEEDLRHNEYYSNVDIIDHYNWD